MDSGARALLLMSRAVDLRGSLVGRLGFPRGEFRGICNAVGARLFGRAGWPVPLIRLMAQSASTRPIGFLKRFDWLTFDFFSLGWLVCLGNICGG
jgi:hypothetical protein